MILYFLIVFLVFSLILLARFLLGSRQVEKKYIEREVFVEPPLPPKDVLRITV